MADGVQLSDELVPLFGHILDLGLHATVVLLEHDTVALDLLLFLLQVANLLVIVLLGALPVLLLLTKLLDHTLTLPLLNQAEFLGLATALVIRVHLQM
jgi:hypothetical protein